MRHSSTLKQVGFTLLIPSILAGAAVAQVSSSPADAKPGLGQVADQPETGELNNAEGLTTPRAHSVDKFGVEMLYPTKPGGRVWFSNWKNSPARTVYSGERDRFNPHLMVRGEGKVTIDTIDDEGIATLCGKEPRLYVYDAAYKTDQGKKWQNVEITFYAKRVSESQLLDRQGFVAGARSEHQDADDQNPCAGRTYYGRLLYNGDVNFQKEVIHHKDDKNERLNGYITRENKKVGWDTRDGSMPGDVWIGFKFVVRNVNNNSHVKLTLYRKMEDGANGGDWERINEITDRGQWSQDAALKEFVEKKCHLPVNEILLKPGTSVFIRNSGITAAQYKWFSIREIEPEPGTDEVPAVGTEQTEKALLEQKPQVTPIYIVRPSVISRKTERVRQINLDSTILTSFTDPYDRTASWNKQNTLRIRHEKVESKARNDTFARYGVGVDLQLNKRYTKRAWTRILLRGEWRKTPGGDREHYPGRQAVGQLTLRLDKKLGAPTWDDGLCQEKRTFLSRSILGVQLAYKHVWRRDGQEIDRHKHGFIPSLRYTYIVSDTCRLIGDYTLANSLDQQDNFSLAAEVSLNKRIATELSLGKHGAWSATLSWYPSNTYANAEDRIEP